MTTAALPLPYSRWRWWLWRHPESWILLLSAGAWFFFIANGAFEALRTSPIPHADAAYAGHNHALTLHLPGAWPALAAHWPLMIAAMMFPPLIGQLRVVAARSLWYRRNRAMALFIGGYSVLWILFGVSTEAGLQLQRTLWRDSLVFLVPLCFLMAAFWQLTPRKRLSLVTCHATVPLAPTGWRADLDCWRYGSRIAASCCMSCWALMLACAAAHHALWAMLVVTCVAWSERFLRRPRQLWFFLALFAVALLAASNI